MQTKEKLSITEEEMRIVLECIYALNFQGKDVEKVGVLAHKIKNKLNKIDKNKKDLQQ